MSLTDSSENFPDIFAWIANTFGSQFSGRFGTLSTAVTTTNSANSHHSEVDHNSTIVGISQTPDSTLNINAVSEFAIGNMKGVVDLTISDLWRNTRTPKFLREIREIRGHPSF
jgi:hypothetical protein